MSFIVESDHAVHGSKSEEEQHRIKQDESTDGSQRVLTQNHQGNQPDSSSLEMQFLSSEISQWNAKSSKGRVKYSHKSIVEFFGVYFARLELERAIVSSQVSGQTDEHLSKRRMDIEIKLSFQVM